MIFGYAAFVIGYAIFYWGYHHFGNLPKYSLSYLLGFGSLFGTRLPPGPKVQIQEPGASNAQTPNNLTNPASQNVPGVGTIGAYQPAGPGLTIGRTDQGVDFAGSGPLYAVGSGTIVNVFNPGWPGGTFIVLKLDQPAGLPSPDVYYAEDIAPNVSVGQHVVAGQLIGRATGGSSGIELGWADPNRIGQALAAGQYKEGQPTSLGQTFRNWITKDILQ